MAGRELVEFVKSRAEHLVGLWLQSVSLADAEFEQIEVDQLDDRSNWARPGLMVLRRTITRVPERPRILIS